jgi:segregation and condensation protein A
LNVDAPAQDEALGALSAPKDAFVIALPNFEGPLDLLLHLIKEHQVDIFDIPIALITEKYLAHLKTMREIDLDIAGEFLVMAATLLHLKSRLLLPRDPSADLEAAAAQEEQGDPRAELVRRLLEYQKYKDAAEQLSSNDLLDRNVFTRKVQHESIPLDPDEIGVKEISVFKLIEALDRVLKALEPKKQHEVMRDHLSLSEAIMNVARKLNAGGAVAFTALFEGQKTRSQVVVTFLALLEMCKQKLVRVFMDEHEEIHVTGRGEALEAMATTVAQGAEHDFE